MISEGKFGSAASDELEKLVLIYGSRSGWTGL